MSFAWLTLAPVRKFNALFNDLAIPYRFVGGCVRDGLLGRKVHDIDVATPLPPAELMEKLSDADCRVVPTGLAHGTVTVIIDAMPFEVTTLRRDVACDGRHAQVEYTDDWVQDAQRRDFTMNALMLSGDGELHDYTGGQQDAVNGIVRFIGDPEARIKEDYLRILRMFRFQATHGAQPLDGAVLEICARYSPALARLSVERIAQEMLKLLLAPGCADVLALMHQSDVWHVIAGQAAGGSTDHFDKAVMRLRHYIALTKAHHIPPHAMARLVVLCEEDAAAIARHWKWANRDITFIRRMADMPVMHTVRDVRCALADMPHDIVMHSYLWRCAREGVGDAALLDVIRTMQPPEFPVQSSDLMALGYTQGKPLGDALRQLRARWKAEGCTMTKDTLLQYLHTGDEKSD